MDITEKKQIVKDTLAFMQEREMNSADMHRLSGVSEEYLSEMFKANSKFKYNAGAGNTGDIP